MANPRDCFRTDYFQKKTERQSQHHLIEHEKKLFLIHIFFPHNEILLFCSPMDLFVNCFMQNRQVAENLVLVDENGDEAEINIPEYSLDELLRGDSSSLMLTVSEMIEDIPDTGA